MFTRTRALAIAMREPILLALAGFLLMMSLAAIGASTTPATASAEESPRPEEHAPW